MKNLSLYYTLGLFVLLLTGMYSCKKVNGINNNTVVETPYSLYFSDTAGTVFVSTDGKNAKIIFPADAKPCRSLLTSAGNILFAKNNLYVSNNNGINFNLTTDSLITGSAFNVLGLSSYAINGLPIDFNQTMVVNISNWNNRVYACSDHYFVNDTVNMLGLIRSDGNGALGTWYTEPYDTSEGVLGDNPTVGPLPVRMTSLTQLTNGYVCGLAYGYNSGATLRYVRNFYKPTQDLTNRANCWKEVTADPDNVTSVIIYSVGVTSGTTIFNNTYKALPPFAASPDSSFFTLGHYNNRLIAIDRKGEYGAWYSDDYGANWYQYSGLPPNTPLLCISSPFEQVCLIGTDSSGLYILNVNTGIWQPNNNGVDKNLIVRNIAYKETIYKNGTINQYVYLATNKGIFQSIDGGHNWILTIPGNYVSVY